MLRVLYFISFLFPSLAARKALKLFLIPKKYERPEAEKKWFSFSRNRFLNNGLSMNEWGIEGNPKVMLVHGWEGRGTQMGAFAEPLVQKGYHVIALDGPAHGSSPGIETNAGHYSRTLVSAQQELGVVHAIIAHSFGGGCSILACDLGLKVDKLVTIASPADYANVVAFFLKEVRLSPCSQKAFYSILAQKAQLKLENVNIKSLGRNLEIPILIVHDKNDKEVRFENAKELHQSWTHSKLLATEGLGHRRILKDTDVIQKIVEFIQYE